MSRYLNLIRNISNWPLHLKIKLGLTRDDPAIFVAKNDIKFEVPRRLYHEFKEIFFEDAYFVGQKNKIKNPRPTIIDIGANVGFFTMYAISKYPEALIYSYEPIEKNFYQLVRNKDHNSSKNIKCFNKAVCGHKGEISISLDTKDSFTTSATILGPNDQNMDTMKVPCLGLADIFDENNITECDFLKLDCEGAEFEILYNAPSECLAKIQQIAMEVHQGTGENKNLQALIKFFVKQNFNTHQIDNNPHMLWAFRD